MFATFVAVVISALELLIMKLFKQECQKAMEKEGIWKVKAERTRQEESKEILVQDKAVERESTVELQVESEQEKAPKPPVKSVLAGEYHRMKEIFQKLENQNYAVLQKCR